MSDGSTAHPATSKVKIAIILIANPVPPRRFLRNTKQNLSRLPTAKNPPTKVMNPAQKIKGQNGLTTI